MTTTNDNNTPHPMFNANNPFTKPYDLMSKKYYPFIDRVWYSLYRDPLYKEDINPYHHDEKRILNYFTAKEHSYFKDNLKQLRRISQQSEELEYLWEYGLTGEVTQTERYVSFSSTLKHQLLNKLTRQELIAIISPPSRDFDYMKIWTDSIKELEVKDKFTWNKKRLRFEY